MNQFFRRKSVADCENDIAERGGLKRSLDKWHLTALGVGATIGAGHLRDHRHRHRGRSPLRPGAGPAIVLSFLLTAVACGFAALCYAEFAAMVPISGSAYTYAYASLGEFVAWIIGWDLIIEYAVGNIGVAIGWSGYFRELVGHFGIEIPAWLATDLPLGATWRRPRWPGAPPMPPTCIFASAVTQRAPHPRLPDHRQSAGVPGGRGDHGGAGDRHQGIGQHQQRDGAAQDRHHPVLHRRGTSS